MEISHFMLAADALGIATPVRLVQLLPELLLTAVACVSLLAGQSKSESWRTRLPLIAVAAVAASILMISIRSVAALVDPLDFSIHSGLMFDGVAHFVRRSTLIMSVMILLVAWGQGLRDEIGEFMSMMLFSIVGLMLLGAAANLVLLFLLLEMVSIPAYALVVLSRRNPRSLEAGTKYFYLGALSAAITAYGLSLVFGVAGSATIDSAAQSRFVAALADNGSFQQSLAYAGLLISIAGILFKLAAFPFHYYIGDVYEGASAPVAGMLGFVPKLAGIVAIFKLLTLASWQVLEPALFWMLWVVAAISMTYGNVLALRQTNIKRMLGFSGIAHSGYMIVGILAAPVVSQGWGDGAAAVLFYAVVYGIANLGAFAVLTMLSVNGRPCETVRDVAGLLARSPASALLLVLAMFTLMGMPPTPGFWGKVGLFGSALGLSQSDLGPQSTWIVVLVVIAVINSAIGAAYYLRVIASVLLYENDDAAREQDHAPRQMGAMLCGALTLFFAFYPTALLSPSRSAARDVRGVPATLNATPEAAPPSPALTSAVGPPEADSP